ERTLRDVVGVRAGLSERQIVVVAHRDALWRPATADLSGTAALLELARVFNGRTLNKTLVLASTSGGSGGAAGAAALADDLAGGPALAQRRAGPGTRDRGLPRAPGPDGSHRAAQHHRPGQPRRGGQRAAGGDPRRGQGRPRLGVPAGGGGADAPGGAGGDRRDGAGAPAPVPAGDVGGLGAGGRGAVRRRAAVRV